MIFTIVGRMRGAWAVAGRELLSLFVTPLAYVVGTLFLLQQGWNFALLLQVLNDPLAAPGPVMQFYFGGSFFIFWLPVIFLCAAISMRLVAEERKQGTLEALLTAPLTPAQVVLGKFGGALTFYTVLWTPTLVFYVLLRGAEIMPDPGPIIAGYLGTLLVGASFLAMGLVASAASNSQLGAAIGTFVACTILLLAGLLVDQVESDTLRELLAQTSLLAMMQEMAQGIVDTRWIWLHVGIVTGSLALATAIIDPRRRLEHVLQLALLGVAITHLVWFGMRHTERGDWTGSHVYSLSERAEAVLAELTKPIEIRVIVPETIGGGRPNPLAQELREVLLRMGRMAPSLRVRLLDPDRERQQAEQWVTEFGLGGRDLADGVVLIQAGQGAELRREHLWPGDLVTYATGADVQATGPRIKEFRGEESLLAAFVRVTHPVDAAVCHTQGHGEPDLRSFEPFGGYAHLHDLIESTGMTLHVADLDDPNGLRDCDILLVAGPAGVLPTAHVAAVERFAEAGGHLLVLSGAVIVPGALGLAPHGLESLLARYGVRYGDRVVLDPHEMPGGTPLLSFTLLEGWGDHPVSRSLIGRAASFVMVRELFVEPVDGAQAPAPLVHSSEDAWAESDVLAVRRGHPVEVDDEDRPGPIPIGVAAQRGSSKVVVIASDQFVLNAYLREDVVYDHGRDLVLNSLGWLSGRDVLLGIRPRAREHVKLVLLPGQLHRMVALCLIGLPAFWALLGLWIAWSRRR